jgi:hypothetical protein
MQTRQYTDRRFLTTAPPGLAWVARSRFNSRIRALIVAARRNVVGALAGIGMGDIASEPVRGCEDTAA